MRRTVAEIQKCRPGLCLPEKADQTLAVFRVVDQLQTLLLELEKVSQSVDQSISQSWTTDLSFTEAFSLLFLQKVPAMFIQQPPTPIQAKAQSAEQAPCQPQPLKSSSEEAEVSFGHHPTFVFCFVISWLFHFSD